MVRVIPRAWWPVSEPYGDFDFNRGTNKNSMSWFTSPYRDHRKEEPVISAVGGCVMRGIVASGVGTNHSHAGQASPALWEAAAPTSTHTPGWALVASLGLGVPGDGTTANRRRAGNRSQHKKARSSPRDRYTTSEGLQNYLKGPSEELPFPLSGWGQSLRKTCLNYYCGSLKPCAG